MWHERGVGRSSSDRNVSDSQTLKDVGIFGNRYKLILGSKSYDPTGRPEDCPPVPTDPYRSMLEAHMIYSLGDFLAKEDTKKLVAFMWEVNGNSK